MASSWPWQTCQYFFKKGLVQEFNIQKTLLVTIEWLNIYDNINDQLQNHRHHLRPVLAWPKVFKQCLICTSLKMSGCFFGHSYTDKQVGSENHLHDYRQDITFYTLHIQNIPSLVHRCIPPSFKPKSKTLQSRLILPSHHFTVPPLHSKQKCNISVCSAQPNSTQTLYSHVVNYHPALG